MISDVSGELRKYLTSKHVPTSLDPDLLFVFEVLEAGVWIAPTLFIEIVDFYLSLRVVVDDLCVGLSINSNRLGRDLIAARKVIVYRT